MSLTSRMMGKLLKVKTKFGKLLEGFMIRRNTENRHHGNVW